LAVLGEYNKRFASPDMRTYEALRNLAFDKHTYKHTTLGFLADIERMPKEIEYARGFFKRYYTPDNLTLVVAGDVKADEVFAIVAKQFGAWRGKRATPKIPVEPEPKGERRTKLAYPSPTLERLTVGWRIPSTVAPAKNGALAMILAALVFSDASPLVKEVVLDDQLAESLSPWWDTHRDPELFPVAARVRPGHTPDEVLARVQRALDETAAGKIDAARFDAVKSHLRYALLMRLTTARAAASTIVELLGPSGDPRKLDATYAAIAAATPAELAAFVRDNFTPKRRVVVTLATATPEKTEPAPGAKP